MGAYRIRILTSVDPDLPVGSVVDVPPRGGVIGRAADADVVLAGNTVSRRHASLEPDEDAWLLTPLTSSNATFVEGEQLHQPRRITPGESFQLGGVVCSLVSEAGTNPVWEPLTRPVLLEVHDDGGRCSVFASEHLLEMTPAAAQVLNVLVQSAGRPVHRWDLLEPLGARANLDKHISHLRRALRDAIRSGVLNAGALMAALDSDSDDADVLVRALIVTRKGHGYLLALPPHQVRRREA